MGTEFIGTFLLCFTVAFTAGRDSMAGLAIGTVLAVAVYGGGYISGGHYNPAVTFACLLTGKIDFPGFLVNVISQFLGSVVAGQFALRMLGEGKYGYPSPGDAFTNNDAMIVETICTMFLCLVVLGSACTTQNKGKDFYGYAIGMTVFSCAVSSGRVSGGAFNPAVGVLGFADGNTDDISLYMIGPFFGAFLASIFFRLISPDNVNRATGPFSNWNFTVGEATNKAIAELLGTFFLTYTVAMCASGAKLAAFAIGTSLTTAIYGMGFVSGGHFNPAVTVGIATHTTLNRGTVDWMEVVRYIVAQCAGAAIAVTVANHISDITVGMPAPGLISKGVEYSTGAVASAEVVATATLVYTVLNTCFSKVKDNNYFGYAIGSVVFVMATAVGHISGGGFNPAVCTACIFFGNNVTTNLWIYWAAPCVGGALSAVLYKFTHTRFETASSDTASTPAAAATASTTAAAATPAVDEGSML
jgi:aquaporin Z